MTWAGIVAIIGGALFLMGIFSYVIAELADGGEDFDVRDRELKRHYKYGVVTGICVTLTFMGIIALCTAVCGA